MDNWWKDSELRDTQKTCDLAFDSKNIDLLKQMIKRCFKKGHDESLYSAIRASYLYSGATCSLDIITLQYIQLRQEGKLEEIYEQCVYLMRTAKDLLHSSYNDLKETDNNTQSKAYLDGLSCQLHVNYANILSQSGRYIESINVLNSIVDKGFPMAIGNMALKIADYSFFDKSHQKIMLYKSYNFLKRILQPNVKFPEKTYAETQFRDYFNTIENDLGLEYLNKNYTLNDFLIPMENLSEDEKKYRSWIANYQLSLNQLNDLYLEIEVAYDPLHLPSMLEKIDSKTMPRYHGIFNQIKQEFVSARFLIYDGLSNRDIHYSDKNVYLINTLDYPVYGLGIEKIKAAYRSIYSIFDKIAFFLNVYLKLDIPEKEISFNNLWYKKM